ncbi:hypothetical protein QBC33DRAFT_462532, partial [Phialemonium atrogriseum]
QQIAAENAERDSRIHADIGKTTREFVCNVRHAKMLDGIQSKVGANKKRPRTEDGDRAQLGDGAADVASKDRERKRFFKQIPLVKKRDGDQPEHVTSVLGNIFGVA